MLDHQIVIHFFFFSFSLLFRVFLLDLPDLVPLDLNDLLLTQQRSGCVAVQSKTIASDGIFRLRNTNHRQHLKLFEKKRLNRNVPDQAIQDGSLIHSHFVFQKLLLHEFPSFSLLPGFKIECFFLYFFFFFRCDLLAKCDVFRCVSGVFAEKEFP